PDRSRSTWTRAGMSHTDWHLASGRLAYEANGNPLTLFEYKLETALIAPLPQARDLDPAQVRLDPSGGVSCFAIVPAENSAAGSERKSADGGQFPTYCFDPEAPILRSTSSLERVMTRYSHLRQWQGRFRPREIQVGEGDHKLLSAKVELVEAIAPSDPALSPPQSAMETEVFVNRDVSLRDMQVDMDVARTMLKKRIE